MDKIADTISSSLGNGISAITLLDFDRPADEHPIAETVSIADSGFAESMSDDCSILICPDDKIENFIMCYGFARWVGAYGAGLPQHAVIVQIPVDTEYDMTIPSMSHLAKAIEKDMNGRIDYDFTGTFSNASHAMDRFLSPGSYSLRKANFPILIKDKIEELRSEKERSLEAMCLTEALRIAQLRLAPIRITGFGLKRFADILTAGHVSTGKLDAVKSIPKWLVSGISASPTAFPNIEGEYKAIVECGRIWHDAIFLSDEYKQLFGPFGKGSEIDVEALAEFADDLGIYHSVNALFNGVPISDILA